jgi:hypothetical protein
MQASRQRLTGKYIQISRRLIALLAVMSFFTTAMATAKTIELTVSCKVSGQVEAALADRICTEMMAVLAQAYPAAAFVRSKPDDRPSLGIIIHHATNTSAGLQLDWTSAKGLLLKGERVSVSAMDTKLTSSRRTSLYRRALAVSPMPVE